MLIPLNKFIKDRCCNLKESYDQILEGYPDGLTPTDAVKQKEANFTLAQENSELIRNHRLDSNRYEANISFIELLLNNGVLTCEQLAVSLKITVDMVIQHSKNIPLISATIGKTKVFPKFQFDVGENISHLKNILYSLDKEGVLSSVAIISFFFNKMLLPDGSTRSPANVLTTCISNLENIEYIIREAHCFTVFTAK
jgi:hypothetical protein